MRLLFPVFVCLAALLSASGTAHAVDALEPVALSFSSPAGCPDEHELFERIHARAPRATIAGAGERAPHFIVTITKKAQQQQQQQQFIATLDVTYADGDRAERRSYRSDTCSDVVTAVALATALTIDPNAHDVADPPQPPPAPPIVASPPAAREEPAPTVPSANRWRVGFAALASIEGGVAPDPLFAVPVSADLSAPWRGRPTLRAGFAWAKSGTIAIAEGAGRFTWTTGFVDVCPYAFAFDSRGSRNESGMVTLSPCARVEVGALAGHGERVEPAKTETRTWVAGAALGRLRLAVLGPIFAELEGGARVPFTRDRFTVWPDAEIFRAPAIAAFAGAGIGARFP